MSEKLEFTENELHGLEGIGIRICDTCKKPSKILMICNIDKDNFCLRCVRLHNHNPPEDKIGGA